MKIIIVIYLLSSSQTPAGYQGGGLKYPPPLTYTLAFSADFVGEEESFQDACV